MRPRAAAGEHHEAIVVGAGVVGLATAGSLARRGVGVLLLEAKGPGHDGAGSKGNARIFRLGYPDPLYVQMAELARGLWHDLEDRSGRRLLEETGQLSFGPLAEGVAAALIDAGLPCQVLTAAETAARFPDLRVDGPSYFEPSSGVLAAADCLQALGETTQLARRDWSPVRTVEDDRDHVHVLLEDGTRLSADVVVNCAGHHALDLVDIECPSHRPPTLQQVAYISTDRTTSPLPVFIEWGENMVYGLPVPGHHLYKLAQHVPGAPLNRSEELHSDDDALLATLTEAAGRLLPSLNPSPVSTERCIYDNTVDADFIIDRVGRVVVGCGTSGHGFKFGPLLGDVLADLAVGTTPSIDVSRFSVSRPSRPTGLDP